MKLNLGCGTDYKSGFVNVDMDKNVNANIYHDLNEFPYPFADNKIDYIYCDNILEHLLYPVEFFLECKRILKRNGILHIIYPNMFFWKLRIKYFFGSVLWSNHWSPYHYNALLKPINIFIVLRMIGFDIFEGQEPAMFYDLRKSEVNVKCRKRP